MIPLFTVNMPPKQFLMPRLEEVLYSGYIGQGPKVEEFERKFANYIGNQNVLSLNSGTSALHLAYRLAGVEGGEVITTPMTCTATNMPILANGADIVWADINPHTGMIDPQDVERKITKRTKAITVVSWGGQFPQDVTYLRQKYGIPIIFDAAHALGLGINWSNYDYVAFSLQAIKHITTVDGGILMVRDTDNYKRGKLLRWYGIDRESDRKDFRCEEDIKEWGYKFHMNDVTATIGLVQLNHIDEIIKKHQYCATYYATEIVNPYVKAGYGPSQSYWLYTLLWDKQAYRDGFMRDAADAGVQVSRVHERNDKHTVFAKYARTLPGVDEFTSKMVCIPCHSKLTLDDLRKVVCVVNNYGLVVGMP